MADEPELSRGASGEWVRYLQQLLERFRSSRVERGFTLYRNGNWERN